jgi:hypothetical protein
MKTSKISRATLVRPCARVRYYRTLLCLPCHRVAKPKRYQRGEKKKKK